MSRRVFRFHARTAHHEVGAFGHVRPSAIVRLLQETAIEASTDAGFSEAWYREAGTQWMVRRTKLEIDEPLRGGESVEVTTSVADFRRVLSRREYEVRGADGRRFARGWSDWVYVDVVRGRPRSVPPEMQTAFLPNGAAERIERATLEIGEGAGGAFRHRQRVTLRDLDGFAHMNNAATIDLLEETLFAALARAGHPLDRLLADGKAVRLRSVDVEYLAEARHGELLEGRLRGAVSPAGELLAGFEVSATAREDATLTRARSEWSGLPPLENLPADV